MQLQVQDAPCGMDGTTVCASPGNEIVPGVLPPLHLSVSVELAHFDLDHLLDLTLRASVPRCIPPGTGGAMAR